MSRGKLFGLVAVLVLLLAGTAQAADVKASGYWWMEAISRQNWNFDKGQDDHFAVEEKLRTAFTFTANENLRAVLDTQIGTANWGNGMYQISAGRTPSTSAIGGAAAGAGNIMLRRAFIEYKWPNTQTNISVGFQTITLPAAFGGGSAILDDQIAAAVVSTPVTENVSLLAGYARPYDSNTPGSTASVQGTGTSTDVLFAAVPMTFDSVKISPFAMYGYSGARTASAGAAGATSLSGFSGANSDKTDGLRGYWGGAAFTLAPADMPFKVMADYNYGKVTYTNYTNNTRNGGRAGWLADLAVDYTGLTYMTPEAFFAYSSGETGKNTNRSGRMPVVGVPQDWTIGSFFFGERLELTGSINTTAGYTSNTLGYWAGGVSLKDITFIDKLSHTVNILYARGTNSVDYLKNTANLNNINYAGFLTDKDSLWEVDLNTKYKFYDELTGYLYLGYIKSDFNMDAWRGATNLSAATLNNLAGVNHSGDAYKVGLGLNYFF
ncbi:MAG: outer membrane homotrimeric porin [Humidesulfovibrio sp.]|nr:outer membrane homotrimeric porin [Humidesulfovibrio sp.]